MENPSWQQLRLISVGVDGALSIGEIGEAPAYVVRLTPAATERVRQRSSSRTAPSPRIPGTIATRRSPRSSTWPRRRPTPTRAASCTVRWGTLRCPR